MVSRWINPMRKWTLTKNNSRLRCQCDFALWQVLLRQHCHLSQTKMHISQVERKCLLFSQTAWCPCHSPLLPCQRAQLILKDSAASRISQLEFITQFTPQLNSIPPPLPPFTKTQSSSLESRGARWQAAHEQLHPGDQAAAHLLSDKRVWTTLSGGHVVPPRPAAMTDGRGLAVFEAASTRGCESASSRLCSPAGFRKAANKKTNKKVEERKKLDSCAENVFFSLLARHAYCKKKQDDKRLLLCQRPGLHFV